MTATYELLFETGEGDGYWTIERTPEGSLCVTTNAETRQVVGPDNYRGWDLDELRANLVNDGVPADVADEFARQVG